jgi:predicted site-specific integrase-resolvase
MCDVDVTTVRRWVKRGQVHSVKVGGTRLVFLPAELVEAFAPPREAS